MVEKDDEIEVVYIRAIYRKKTKHFEITINNQIYDVETTGPWAKSIKTTPLAPGKYGLICDVVKWCVGALREHNIIKE
jgi:hypothetical protein